MTQLTKEQLEELDIIRADRISLGAFSGMVFNSLDQFDDDAIERAVQRALQVRVVTRRMK